MFGTCSRNCVLLLTLLFPLVIDSQELGVQEYKDVKTYKEAEERRVFARDTVMLSDDEDVLYEAVNDMLRYSATQAENEIALNAVDSVLSQLTPSSYSFQLAMLAKGKLLKRLGRTSESEELFEDAIHENWKEAMWRYSESLIDAGELHKACQLEFRRVTAQGSDQFYRSKHEDLSTFITLLNMMKNDQPNASAVEMVLNEVQPSEVYPYVFEIAKALCLAKDGEYESALIKI